MSRSNTSLDLSFTTGRGQNWARVMVVRPGRDYDEAVTLDGCAVSLEDFENYLDRLQRDIEVVRDKARQAFGCSQSFEEAA